MPTRVSQSELLVRAKEGSFDAFATLTEQFRQPACTFLSQFVDPSSAEDLFITATLNAWRALASFNENSSFQTWFFAIAHHAALDHLRKIKSRHEISLDDDATAPALLNQSDDSTPSPQVSLEIQDRNSRLESYINQLPEHHRTPLVLYYYQNFQYAEIASALHISLGTVMSRIHHAKAKLKKLLSPHKKDLLS